MLAERQVAASLAPHTKKPVQWPDLEAEWQRLDRVLVADQSLTSERDELRKALGLS